MEHKKIARDIIKNINKIATGRTIGKLNTDNKISEAFSLFLTGNIYTLVDFEAAKIDFQSEDDKMNFMDNGVLNEIGVFYKFYNNANEDQKKLMILNWRSSLYTIESWTKSIPDHMLKYSTIAGRGSVLDKFKTLNVLTETITTNRILNSDLTTKNMFFSNPLNIAALFTGSPLKVSPNSNHAYQVREFVPYLTKIKEDIQKFGIGNVYYSNLFFSNFDSFNRRECSLVADEKEEMFNYIDERRNLAFGEISDNKIKEISQNGSVVEKIMIIENPYIDNNRKAIFILDNDEFVFNSVLGLEGLNVSDDLISKMKEKRKLHPVHAIEIIAKEGLSPAYRKSLYNELEKNLSSGVFADPLKYETNIYLEGGSDLLSIEEDIAPEIKSKLTF